MADELVNLITYGTLHAYACPNVSTRATQIRQSIPIPGWMRAPGEAEGSFAMESAIDELSYALGIDPIELRVKNHAHVHPDSGLPWSSNALLECYRQGAERFGWSGRNPEPRSTRQGGQLVGYGMARGALGAYQPPCKAIATIRRDGTAFVRSGATDIGPGPYTVMTMIAADCLGVPIERVRFGLGDSAMPRAPQEGGSGLTGALGNAVHATCVSLVRAFVNLVHDDEGSPLKGCRLEGITVRDGGIQITDDPVRFETYADILTRHGLDELTIEGESAPPGETSSATMIVQAGRFIPYTAPSTGARAHAGGYAAHFVEVHVDPDLGTVRVARVVSAVDGGRILNPKTARSQIIGGIAMGIGMALLEETVSDRTGRLATTSLAEYVVAVNADVRDVDVLFVGDPDPMTPLGTKGIGELAIAGMAAAIANAVYHATGTRIRSLPISIEKMLGRESASPRTGSSLEAIPHTTAWSKPKGGGTRCRRQRRCDGQCSVSCRSSHWCSAIRRCLCHRQKQGRIKNVVLVHGGFVDGSGWQGVYDTLKKDGYTVSIVQNPTISLADDVAVTKRTLAAQDGPAILVGHSYGGVVITEAGNDPKVAGLVYIAAFAPDKGESVSALIKNPPPGAPVPPILPPQDGFLLLDRTKFRASFAADVSADAAAFMADSQVPWGLDALNGAVTEPAWKTKPSWYSRLDRGQDDSARRAACDVQARWFDRRRGQREPRCLRVATAGRCGPHREGGERRGARDAVVDGDDSSD